MVETAQSYVATAVRFLRAADNGEINCQTAMNGECDRQILVQVPPNEIQGSPLKVPKTFTYALVSSTLGSAVRS